MRAGKTHKGGCVPRAGAKGQARRQWQGTGRGAQGPWEGVQPNEAAFIGFIEKRRTMPPDW